MPKLEWVHVLESTNVLWVIQLEICSSDFNNLCGNSGLMLMLDSQM